MHARAHLHPHHLRTRREHGHGLSLPTARYYTLFRAVLTGDLPLSRFSRTMRDNARTGVHGCLIAQVTILGSGMNHQEGGWPRDIDPTEPEQKIRLTKKIGPSLPVPKIAV